MNHQHSNCLGPSPSKLEIGRPRHLLEVPEALVGLEGLPERDAGLFAEIVPVQAAGEEKQLGESSTFNLSRAPLDK